MWSFTTTGFTEVETKKLNKIDYDKLHPSCPTSTQIYGTPKEHKFSFSNSFLKVCPTVSSIGIFNYNLFYFLCDLLSECKSFQKNFVSYDVTSRFTNIPLQKTVDIAKNLIFNHNSNINSTKKEL